MMYTPGQYVYRKTNIGDPLPMPFTCFSINNITFRHGTTSMIAATPGSFKSGLALNMVVSWSDQKQRILYFSADMDDDTIMERLNAIVTGDDTTKVSRKSPEKLAEETRHVNLSLIFDARSEDDIQLGIKRYEAVWGLYPDIIFIDNLIDFVEQPDDWGDMLTMTRELDVMARETRAHICIIHHARLRDETQSRKEKKKAYVPPAESEIMGKLTQKPRLVLTTAKDGPAVNVSCVKQTRGPADRTGEKFIEFRVGGNLRLEGEPKYVY